MTLISQVSAIAVLSLFLLSGCGQSAVQKCIDKNSALWDNSDTPKNNNKAYWDAVEKCKNKYN